MSYILLCAAAAAVTAFVVYTLMQKRIAVLEKVAFHDDLVNGYTYPYIKLKAPEIMKNNVESRYILIYLDVDNFKYFSQTFGLEKSSKIINAIYREAQITFSQRKGIVARYHDDKFIIFCQDSENIDDSLKSFIEKLEKLMELYEIDYVLSFSMGACKIADAEVPLDVVLERAMAAHCKYRRNPVIQEYVFSEDMQRQIAIEKSIQENMKTALLNSEFIVLLQPKIDLKNEEVVGAEALVRWNSANLGFMSPKDFIPVFEKTGFIKELDFFVLEAVCGMLSERLASDRKVLPISVNHSRTDCYDSQYLQRIDDIVKRYNLNPSLIEFETTESTFLDDIDVAVDIMSRLRQAGFKISIDDFGLGYTSLSFLKQINVDIIKIDRTLIDTLESNAENRKLVESLIDMSHSLGMQVLGEGVENVAQAEIMRQLGCDLAQGYYYAKPMGIEDFDRFIIDSGASAV